MTFTRSAKVDVLSSAELEFPGEPGLSGHSDADVILHAVADAILGAAALGDIGDHFPPDDENWRDADSGMLLTSVIEMVASQFALVNVDLTVVAEVPKIKPRRLEMRLRLSELLSIDINR